MHESARPSFLSRAIATTDRYIDSSHPATSSLLQPVRLGQPIPEPLRSQLIADEHEYVHARILRPKRNRSVYADAHSVLAWLIAECVIAAAILIICKWAGWL